MPMTDRELLHKLAKRLIALDRSADVDPTHYEDAPVDAEIERLGHAALVDQIREAWRMIDDHLVNTTPDHTERTTELGPPRLQHFPDHNAWCYVRDCVQPHPDGHGLIVAPSAGGTMIFDSRSEAIRALMTETDERGESMALTAADGRTYKMSGA